ncbi:D-alanyl-D-alanine carboxypeptidase family protein [Enterocloster lavalensis]|uniref:D-alanyl-D-alanine carboxypeptidase family protein n=1 Tax=Enterocloster lavalensis TaxID=460384 RepID=UPI001D08823C|nr:D-alanyl-D-alanine carboxypeptidase family protein [Enterocloster lavalensis]MCB6342478.1 serine hydrolase [Enterocloster lavalensis]
MKRLFALCLAFALCAVPMTAWAAPAWPSGVTIQADGGIVMEAGTGTVLYGKNMDHPYYPASITKILTALIVIESCDLNEIVTFSHDAVYNVEEDSSSAGIDEGDQLTVRDCLYALLLASANESANALAEHVSGTREAFADLMNQRAASLGCTGSHFANPSGLNDENHYTTAHDMARIAQAAIQNPTFVEICSSRTYRLPNMKRAPVEKYPDGFPIANHHKMWNRNDAAYYNGAFCGKTGYTSLAGNTLVTCAKRGDMTLIAVVLNGHLTHYTDTKAMLDFGFGNFQSLKISEFETTYTSLDNDMTIAGMTAKDTISLDLDEDSRIVIPKSAGFSDAVPHLSYTLDRNAPSNAIAQVNYTYGDQPVGRSYLLLGGVGGADGSGQAADGTDGGQAAGGSNGNSGSQAADGSNGNGSNGGLAPDGSNANNAGPASDGSNGSNSGGQAADGSNGNGSNGGPAPDGSNANNASPSPDGSNANSASPASDSSNADSGSGASGLIPPGGGGGKPGGGSPNTATSFKIPSNLAAVLGIAASLAVITAIIVAVKLYVRRRQEAMALQRRQRRIQRLEDIGYSTAEFERIMEQYRSSTTSSYTPPGKRSRRKRFPFRRS